jgi:uncharacterized protein with FMN-binding domain
MNRNRFLLAIPFCLALFGCVDLESVVITTPDFHQKPDGVYRGQYSLGPVRVIVDVTVRDGAIDTIDLIQHRNGRGKKAEAVIPEVMEAQYLDVDVVSGATASSKAILKAIEAALE